MNLPSLSSKKLLIPIGLVIFFGSFLSHIPLEGFINKELSKSIPKKCSSDIPTLDISLFPLPKVTANDEFQLSSRCSGMSRSIQISKVDFSSRGISFSPLGLKFKAYIQVNRHKPLELSISFGTSESKIIFNNSKISSGLIKDIIDLPLDIEGDLELNLITLMSYKKGISTLDGTLTSTNLNLPAQMVSGFNIPIIKASPLQIDTKMTPRGDLQLSAIKVGNKENDLYLMGKGDIKSLNNSAKSSIDLMATLALRKDLKTQFSFIDLLLGNSNELGEYKFQVLGKLTSPRVKSLN